MPESHNIGVQQIESVEKDLDNTFQGRVCFFIVLQSSWTPQNQIIQYQKHLPAGTVV